MNEDFLTIRYSYTAVGIEETSQGLGSLLAFPVPCSNTLNIEFQQPQRAFETNLTITDITGRIVMTVPINWNSKRTIGHDFSIA